MNWWLGSILFIIIWVAIACWPARVAARKGHSFILYFLLSLVFFRSSLVDPGLCGSGSHANLTLGRHREGP